MTFNFKPYLKFNWQIALVAVLLATSLWYAVVGREKVEAAERSGEMVKLSRIAVAVWAVLLSGFAIWMAAGHAESENKNLIDLAFGMVAYTYGPLLGVLLAAILPGKKSFVGIVVGTVISVLIVLWVRPELPRLFDAMGLSTAWLETSRPQIAFAWFYPINALITLGFAYLPLGRTTRGAEHAEHAD